MFGCVHVVLRARAVHAARRIRREAVGARVELLEVYALHVPASWWDRWRLLISKYLHEETRRGGGGGATNQRVHTWLNDRFVHCPRITLLCRRGWV